MREVIALAIAFLVAAGCTGRTERTEAGRPRRRGSAAPRTTPVPFGSVDAAVETRGWSPLEPTVIEHKYYVEGVGLVMELAGSEVSRLVSVNG